MPGFRAAGVRCGIKRQGLDLALIASDGPAAAAGVFTRSSVVGAPVELSRERVRSGRARVIVANSGVSNVAMGARGRADARAMTAAAARALGCRPEEVLVASTGVIGHPLPIARIRAGLPRAVRSLRGDGLGAAARAIMTTDTIPKVAVLHTRIDGRRVTLAGIAKGSGMIEPNLATMLSFLLTDAAVAPPLLRRMLRDACRTSFNRLTVDGETSTSDTVLLLANGRAGHATLRDPASAGARRLATALTELSESLARALARDGEGATKLVTVRVAGARSGAEAERAARRIANSMLVKTALFGGDPNWGRILQTVGAARVRIALARAEVRLAGVVVWRHGAPTGPAARARAGRALRAREIEVSIDLGAGRHGTTVWTCDLSYDYVRINADYTT
ncbi:MAG TPA: bifunctional glutamate N-acetyltransferase/amino-acid acetyltransferase ArgJ [Myxococcota bacterium]|nr:bifunctional glutamate N-acetyltransferase/amino-acid acetyltransferase ArgJ [Myxococcota bacterium]